jgi:hypothetical protein
MDLKEYEVSVDDVAVFDIRGNNIKTNGIKPSGKLMEIDLSGNQNGIYFIRVNLGNSVEMIRVIKQ